MHKLIIYTVLEKNINRVKIYVLRQPTHTGYNNNNNNGLSAGKATTLITTFVVTPVWHSVPCYINHLVLREESEGVHR